MNDQFPQDQATHFADRVREEAGQAPDEQAARALWLALSREPSAARVAEAVQFLEQQTAAHAAGGHAPAEASRQALTDLCHVLLNCNEFVYID